MRGALAAPVLLACLLAACGGESPPRPDSTGASEAALPESGMAPLTVRVRVTNLEGAPLAGMAPIVTTQANAFDPPVATGALTGPDGESSITFLPDRALHLRAWDPDLRWFPNNFFDILPGGGEIADALVVVMAPAASLELRLLGPDGTPVAAGAVALMMYHPDRGPWWPAESKTQPDGAVRFEAVPPGEFSLRLKVESGLGIEIPSVALPPAATKQLGDIALQ